MIYLSLFHCSLDAILPLSMEDVILFKPATFT